MIHSPEHYLEIIERCRTRAQIRRQIPRPEPDRISRDLEDAATAIQELLDHMTQYEENLYAVTVGDNWNGG